MLEVRDKRTRARTRKERWRLFEKELKPLHDRSIGDIRRGDIHELLDAIEGRGVPVLRNRVLRLITLIFNAALDREWVEANPAARIKLLEEKSRDRYLSREELKQAWWALVEMGSPRADVVRFCLLTAQRPNQVARMRWDQIHGTTWRVPPEQTKGDLELWVPLSGAVQDLLGSIPRKGEWVFPGRADGSGPVGNPNRASHTVYTTLKMEPWGPHDARTTFQTWGLRPVLSADPDIPPGLGLRGDVIEAVFGHVPNTVAMRHYHGRPEERLLAEKRDALERWGRWVEEVVTNDEGGPGGQ